MDCTSLWHTLSLGEAIQLVSVVDDFVVILLPYAINEQKTIIARLTFLIAVYITPTFKKRI